MIFEKVLDIVFSLIYFIADNFPTSLPSVVFSLGALVEPLEFACYYFGADTLAMVVGNIIMWSYIYLGWIVFEWCYHKIPGIT